MITQERLKELFDFDPETGIFTNKTQRSYNSKIGQKVGTLAQGYFKVVVDRKMYLLHRLAWLYVYGYLPPYIDHINRVSTDNRISNLRPVTKKQNVENQKLASTNKSGYRGVSWDKKRKKWFVSIQHNTKTIALGRFENIEDARDAYCKAAAKYHTHNNHATKEENHAI